MSDREMYRVSRQDWPDVGPAIQWVLQGSGHVPPMLIVVQKNRREWVIDVEALFVVGAIAYPAQV